MPATDAIIRSLNAVLESETFGRSERLRSFLAYVVEKERAGMAHQLKGYSIGIETVRSRQDVDAVAGRIAPPRARTWCRGCPGSGGTAAPRLPSQPVQPSSPWM